MMVELYNQVLDYMIQQLDERFSQETQCFSILQPEKLIDRNTKYVDKLNHLGKNSTN